MELAAVPDAVPDADPVVEAAAAVVASVLAPVVEAALVEEAELLVLEVAERSMVPQVALALQAFWPSRSLGWFAMHWS